MNVQKLVGAILVLLTTTSSPRAQDAYFGATIGQWPGQPTVCHQSLVTSFFPDGCVPAGQSVGVAAWVTVVQNRVIYTELANRSDALKSSTEARLDGINTQLVQLQDLMRVQQQSLIEGMRAELLVRIQALPLELAKDEQAYALLRARLEKDLKEVFQARAPQ